MPKLRDYIENAINETRILLLGVQVLLGFSYRPYFEPGFDRLPRNAQIAQTASIVVLTLALVWLISPALYHHLADRGENTARFQKFTTDILDWGLLPLAVGLGLNGFVIVSFMQLPHPSAYGVGVCVFALAFWYAFTWMHRDSSHITKLRAKLLEEESQQGKSGGTEIETKVRNLLVECRMVLPGVQALLGFQLTTFFMSGFEKLPKSSQLIHLAGLTAIAISTVLVITPAAYHRIAEAGEDTEHFHRVGANLLLSSIIFLGIGLAGDFVVILRLMGLSLHSSVALGCAMLVAAYAFWFGWGLWKKKEAL
jgi:hypothetical protein